MSETENGRQKTTRLDVAIDRAVREMLDVEPPAGLRGRVMDRISVASAFGRKRRFQRKAWALLPIAAAAVIVLAVMIPWHRDTRLVNLSPGPAPAPRAVTTARRPAPGPTAPSSAPLAMSPPSGATPASRTAAQRPESEAIAALADDGAADPSAGERTQIAALEGPAPLFVQELTAPAATPMKSIDVSPIRIAALEVNALPDGPRERQHEE
jgi:hypothetical protein